MTVEIEVVEDPARACGAMLVGASLGGGHVVLTGGSTPRAAYGELVAAVKSVGLDLSDTTYWLGDERCVPPDDERANSRMIEESLLGPLAAVTEPTFKRIRGELGPDEGADDYERELTAAGPPRFDLLLLGLGPDAHTASLFPDQPAVTDRSRLVVGVEMSGLEPFVPRVSLDLRGDRASAPGGRAGVRRVQGRGGRRRVWPGHHAPILTCRRRTFPRSRRSCSS